MYRLILVALLMAGCTPAAGPSHRSPNAPITSVALFDAAEFAGNWNVVAAYDAETCGVDVDYHGNGAFDWVEKACGGSVDNSPARITGPGRFTPKGGAHKGVQHWVLWVDQSYRTAVIASPQGDFAFILNRDREIPADRLRAAREILDWNGFDLAALRLR